MFRIRKRLCQPFSQRTKRNLKKPKLSLVWVWVLHTFLGVPGGGKLRDEFLRTSAWEANTGLDTMEHAF